MKTIRIHRGLMSEEHDKFNDNTVNDFKQNIHIGLPGQMVS